MRAVRVREHVAADTLAWGGLETWAGTVRVAAGVRGVRSVWLPRWGEGAPATPDGHAETATQAPAEATHHLDQALAELAEYFAGRRRVFTMALDPVGTPFLRAVWAEVARVPYGQTQTYGEIAAMVGRPAASRAVGAANGANPLAPIIPCHRIVGSDGRLTGYGPGLPLKQRLLVMEGAVPDGPADFARWVAHITADGTLAAYLASRATGTYCLPGCAHALRRALVPGPVFAAPEQAHAAGYRPCATCLP